MTSLLLFPGAGSASTHSSLLAIEAAVAPTSCVRADFPYRLAGRKVPDRAPVLLQAVREAAAPLLGRKGDLARAGRSVDGRPHVFSLAVGDVDDPLPAKGLVLICYPLHPPGKPDKLRVEHFPRLTVPCLFISGTRTRSARRRAQRLDQPPSRGPVTHEWMEGKGHDLKGCDDRIAPSSPPGALMRFTKRLSGAELGL
jgi:predicted alpha/beta-hydrolase family hydrolase